MSPDHQLSRRALLQLGGVSATALALGVNAAGATAHAAPLSDDPFTLGVASGSPRAGSMVLWTRLAPEPYAPDGHGGLGLDPVTVEWEVASDAEFADVVRSGTALAQPELAHSVHPKADELKPNTPYWYRFHAGGHTSAVGQFRTMPPPGRSIDSFTIGMASCQAWYHGHFTALRHLAAEPDLDLVVFAGDYIYEYGITEANLWRQGASVTAAEEVDCHTLEQYRLRYGRFKADPHLRAAHARTAWAFTWDDHEVVNNYTGGYGAELSPELFDHRRAVAYRAYYEHLPLALDALPTGPDTTIHDVIDIGSLARLTMVDTRQHRDQHATDDNRYDPRRTMLGRDQERWLARQLRTSRARWNLIGNSVTFVPIRPDADVESWDGYPAARDRMMNAIRGVSNPVVLTGDIHRSVAAELPADLDDPEGATAAVELICTSTGSNGDGSAEDGNTEEWLAHPFVKFYDGRRGYVLMTITAKELTSRFVAVDWVESDDTAPRLEAASYTTPSGQSRLIPAEPA